MHIRGGIVVVLALFGLTTLNSTADAGSIWFQPSPYLSSDDMPADLAAIYPLIVDFDYG